MALSSFVFRPNNDWWDLWNWPERIFDQHFGVALSDDDFVPSSLSRYHDRPISRRLWRDRKSAVKSGMSEVVNTKDKFQINLDVSQFAPEEINVKVVDNKSITIEGNHEEKQDDHGFISRHFVRRYVLPRNCEVDKIASSLSSNGVLSISAPKKVVEAIKPSEKVIPITMAAPMETDDQAVQKK
ncbi:alpha-crystallin A chain [Tetranychus urticae]|uniref:alpha-crystallin A chain n=1 Tax=Tetranychus urticae TaxID=32264 RepID=UPI00077BF0A3|nr:alpha-crystallin A chain [Tetranychus urticae]